MSHRFFELASGSVLAAVIGTALLGTTPARGPEPVHRFAAEGGCEELDAAAHAGRKAGSVGSVHERLRDSAGTAERPRQQGILHEGRGRCLCRQGSARTEVDRAGNLWRRALQHGPVWPRKGPVQSCGDHSHFADRRTRRPRACDAAGGSGESGRRARRRTRAMSSTDRRTAVWPSSCIIWGNEGPPMLPEGYNSNLQIVQGEGYVAIEQEMIHDVRIIPTDGRPHLPADVHQWLGDSRGHWEGNTLVVDTTNFTDKTAFRGSSTNLHVVERFTRTDADTVKYSSRFRIRRPGRSPGAAKFRCRRSTVRSSNTPARKATTVCRIISAARAPRRRRPPKKPLRSNRSEVTGVRK